MFPPFRKDLALRLTFLVLGLSACSCGKEDPESLSLSSSRRVNRPLDLGDRVPDAAENEVVGAVAVRVLRKSSQWQLLVHCQSPHVTFKDEERTGADRLMTPLLCSRLTRLGELASRKWPDLGLRVTEAWDENGEHGRGSLHYEGRAADVTTSDMDAVKLGRLGQLAVEAGFDWVYYEDRSHVHVSVKRSR